MKLLILAGGKGSRLGYKDIPKPMVKIGDKPLLELQIELAKRYGLKDIYILSGYKAAVIKEYFGDGRDFGVNIYHIVEDQELGTAGAVKQLESIINDRFMVFYGDTVMDINLKNMQDFDSKSQGIATILVHPNDHPGDSDLVEIDHDNNVTHFHSKPHQENKYYTNLVNAALYIFDPQIFNYIPDNKKIDFGKDVFPALLKDNKKIYGYKTPEYIKDMGTKNRLEQTTAHYLSGKVARLNSDNKRKAIFLDRDGVINKEVHNLSKIEDFELFKNTASAIKKINGSEYLAIVITNQSAIAKGFLTELGLAKIHQKMESLLGKEGAYIDGLYYCPHYPESGFEGEVKELKIKCECRKPGTDMFLKAAVDFNIDLEKSYFIGDTTVDNMAANNAGMKAILVRTGYGGSDKRQPSIPNFICKDIKEAVDLVVDDHKNIKNKAMDILGDTLKKTKNNNHLIVVAGLSRSGKSTFCNILKEVLKKNKIKASTLNLDNWLVPVKERNLEMTVQGRYKYNEIQEDIKSLLEGQEISLNEYDAKTREVKKIQKKLKLAKQEVLIVDGVVGLDLKYLREIADLKIYVEVSEDLRKERFTDFYEYKGLALKDMQALYETRQKDEVDFIKKTASYADITINMEQL